MAAILQFWTKKLVCVFSFYVSIGVPFSVNIQMIKKTALFDKSMSHMCISKSFNAPLPQSAVAPPANASSHLKSANISAGQR